LALINTDNELGTVINCKLIEKVYRIKITIIEIKEQAQKIDAV
jgi:hypothetical protein